jgi:hypothetical protein
MSEFEIDFKGQVAADYDFRPPTAEEVNAWRVRPQILPEMPEHEWRLYLGHVVPTGNVRDHQFKAEVLERAVTVLVECKAIPFHKVALTVARKLGTIVPNGDRLLTWYELACDLRWMFESMRAGKEYTWPHPEGQLVGSLGLFLVSGRDKRPMLALRPLSLDAALTLYAARMIATGTTFNICENCKTPFLVGGTRFRNKRGDARFCSDECRWKWHNESRRKAR